MKERRERALILALSFVVPGLVMLWVYASLGIAPFGDRTVLVSDMSSQYVDFFCALKNGDLFFSWSKVLGTGYIGVFSYYVSSPLSLLTLLVPNEAMPAGLALLVVLKIALAGLSFCAFVQRRFPDCGFPALVCAVCYALMSYNAVYSLCIMWLDGVIWLPLILLALERILAGKGAGPFVGALTVCFISTWYISYMVGIFCALYLCVRLIALKPAGKALKTVLLRFFGGAACALGLTAWLWLPTFLAMFIGKFSGGSSSVYGSPVLCSPILLLAQMLPGQFKTLTNSSLPFVFCGTAVVILVLAHFLFWNPYNREKLAERGLLILLGLSMVYSPLDKVWHLFQRPNWFPFRYSFLFSFFLLYLAVQALPRILAALEKRGPWVRRGAAAALAVFAVVDMGINARAIISGVQEKYGSDTYQGYRSNYTASAGLTAAAQTDAGGHFFRMGSTADRGDRGLNNPLAMGYPGISHYSSLYNYDVNRLLKSLGFAQSWYWCNYRGSTPVTDALFGMEYVISRDDMPQSYGPVAQADGLTLWKNPDVLPLAFLAEGNAPGLEGDSPFERQNSLISGLLGENVELFIPVLTEVDIQAEGTVLTIVGRGKPIYADLSASGLTKVLVNGEHLLSLGSDVNASIHYLGTPTDGEVWTAAICGSTGWTGQLWELDQEVLRAAVAQLNNTEITEVGKNGLVRLTAQSSKGQILMTTIPAEDGWTAYVDGQKVDTTTWLGTFLAVVFPAGEHAVELRYTAPGVVPGIGLGVLSLAGLVLAALRKKKTR